MKRYICNAFSLNMLPRDGSVRVIAHPYSTEHARNAVHGDGPEWISAVGHESTAAVFSAVLGREVPANRVTVELGPDDVLLVGQYHGPRLDEGATELPEGATIEWWLVRRG